MRLEGVSVYILLYLAGTICGKIININMYHEEVFAVKEIKKRDVIPLEDYQTYFPAVAWDDPRVQNDTTTDSHQFHFNNGTFDIKLGANLSERHGEKQLYYPHQSLSSEYVRNNDIQIQDSSSKSIQDINNNISEEDDDDFSESNEESSNSEGDTQLEELEYFINQHAHHITKRSTDNRVEETPKTPKRKKKRRRKTKEEDLSEPLMDVVLYIGIPAVVCLTLLMAYAWYYCFCKGGKCCIERKIIDRINKKMQVNRERFYEIAKVDRHGRIYVENLTEEETTALINVINIFEQYAHAEAKRVRMGY